MRIRQRVELHWVKLGGRTRMRPFEADTTQKARRMAANWATNHLPVGGGKTIVNKGTVVYE